MLFIFAGNLSIAGNAPLLPESSPFSPETLLSRWSVKKANFIIMEKLSKLEACSLLQSKGSFVDNSDRISNLPNHIAHHILSFLTMENIARLSVVSKWWQELCISIPSLTLNVDGRRYKGKDFKLIYFKNFLDRLMLRRNGMKMVQFCVHWTFPDWHSEEYRFLTWLHDAVRSNVEVLYLDLCIFRRGTFHMPLCVLHCESLRFLTVSLFGGVLQLPSSTGFKKLQSLSLTHVRVLDDLFVERVLSSCNSLDKLCLHGVNGTNNISIQSSSLKYLEITSYMHNDLFHVNVSGELLEELIICWKFFPSGGRSLKIATPHLKCFTWGGFAPDNYFLGNLKCLRSCALSLEQLSSSWRPPHMEYFQFLEGIKDLVIQFPCLQALYEAGMLPIPLKHVHTLRINFTDSDYDNLVPAMALLLKGAAKALDKIKFLSLTRKEILGKGKNTERDIQIKLDKEKKILSICDRGIGMTKDDLIKNLGIIAKSGTSVFGEKTQTS